MSTLTKGCEAYLFPPHITVIGIGGAGWNAVRHIMQAKVRPVTTVVVDSDAKSLQKVEADHAVLYPSDNSHERQTDGVDTGPQWQEQIRNILELTDFAIIIAGMGGRISSRIALAIARMAKEMGVLTLGFVTKTSAACEDKQRSDTAALGTVQFLLHIDGLAVFSGNRLMQLAPRHITYKDMLDHADRIIADSVKAVVSAVSSPAITGIGLHQLRALLKDRGRVFIGSATASGEDRAIMAAKKATFSPLCRLYPLHSARRVLLVITGGSDLSLTTNTGEIAEARAVVQKAMQPDADLYLATVCDDTMGDEVRVTIFATEFVREGKRQYS